MDKSEIYLNVNVSKMCCTQHRILTSVFFISFVSSQINVISRLLKGEFQCKTDLGYVLYDNVLKRSFLSTKNAYKRFLQLAVFSRFYQNAINLEQMGAVVMVKTKSLF